MALAIRAPLPAVTSALQLGQLDRVVGAKQRDLVAMGLFERVQALLVGAALDAIHLHQVLEHLQAEGAVRGGVISPR